jgi:hypothetical protein
MKELEEKLNLELNKIKSKTDSENNTIKGIKNKVDIKAKNLKDFNILLTKLCNEYTNDENLDVIKDIQVKFYSKYLNL